MPSIAAKTTKVTEVKVDKTKETVRKFSFKGLNTVLGTIFYLLWIIIGVFFLTFLVLSFKQGAFDQLLGRGPSASQSQASGPAEADIPGVGRVNIVCTQKALSDASIQKLLQAKDLSALTQDEKAKFEPCIIAKETPGSSPSATPGQ